jgi:hypothetical protein
MENYCADNWHGAYAPIVQIKFCHSLVYHFSVRGMRNIPVWFIPDS